MSTITRIIKMKNLINLYPIAVYEYVHFITQPSLGVVVAS